MKLLHLGLLLCGFTICGCSVLDPEIPKDYSSYEKGGQPSAYIRVKDLFSFGVALKTNIATTGDRKLTDFRICYSETNQLPDTTDYVQDVFFQYKPGQNELYLSLSDLDPFTKYYCRLYLANADTCSYSNSIAFTTKVANNDTSWEQVASIPWPGEFYSRGLNFADRFFTISTDLPVEGGNPLIEYLPDTDEWVKRSIVPMGCRFNPLTVVAAGKGYVGMGEELFFDEEGRELYACKQDWWCYDPETNKWERKADVPASSIAVMAAFAIEEKIYVVSSVDFWNITPMQVWVYDTRTDVWSQRRNFPGEKLQHAASFVIDGTPYVFTGTTNRLPVGGKKEDSEYVFTPDMWKYEEAADAWYRVADFKGGGREGMVAVACNGLGYAGFGRYSVGNSYLYDSVDWWVYDPEKNQWKQRCVLTEWVNYIPSFAFVLRGNIYIGNSDFGVWKYVE